MIRTILTIILFFVFGYIFYRGVTYVLEAIILNPDRIFYVFITGASVFPSYWLAQFVVRKLVPKDDG